MSVNHQSLAAKRGQAATFHTGVSLQKIYPHVQVTTANGQSSNLPTSSQLVLHQNTEDRYFAAISGTANALTQSGYVDIRIPAGAGGVCRAMTLEFNISNATGATITPAVFPTSNTWAPVHALVERVEILAENGSQLVSRHESTQLLLDYRHLDPQQLTALRYGANLANNPPDGATWVTGTSRNAYLPLLFNAFVANSVHLGGLKSDLYIRVWMKGPSAWGSVPNGAPTLTSLNLIVSQDNLGRPEQYQLIERYRGGSLDFRYHREGFQSIVAELTGGQKYNFQLTAVTGLITDITVFTRLASGTGDNALYWYPTTSIELLDASGSNIVGGSMLGTEYMMYVKGSRQASNFESIQTYRALHFDFGSSTRHNLEHSVITGYIPASGDLQLSFISASTGTMEIRVEYHTVGRLNIRGGSVEVLPS
jgi:hypothetical protein